MTPITISATKAKLQFGSMLTKAKEGSPIIVERNDTPEVVWISIDDYEDFLELKDTEFQRSIETGYKEMKKGKSGGLDTLYALHRKKIVEEAN